MNEAKSINDMNISERISMFSKAYADNQRGKSRELIGHEYGMTGRNIARYVRCNQLIPEFKEMLDDGSLAIIAGVELSFLSEGEQALVLDVMEQNCIKLKKDIADKLRAAAGSITKETVQEVFGVDKPVSEVKRPVSVKLPAKVYSMYFANVAAKDVQGILEAALEQYFMKKGA